MFVITFYSYKGGVGRTMSLVNVASELSQRGRKVLVIDFDLEAPGIPSFRQFTASESRVGIVDYVSQYIETSAAPDVRDFIVEAQLDTQTETLPIWVLPAGRRDQHYGTKLSSIDWQDLYQTRSGYLLFEDLKQQIANDTRAFDYVLIDSRTGHTDVGGICTRQLADAITFMFFPNKQNISGLKTIVDEIRSDAHVNVKRTKMFFCPSNVPDLDDEEGILRSMLDEASRELGYDEPAATIRHYNSMSLVDQKVFVIDRPKTKLAAEYRHLTEELMSSNVDDRDGAILYLQKVISGFRGRAKKGPKGATARSLPLDEITAELERINSKHRHDGEICWLMAALYNHLGDFANEMEALGGAINAGFDVQKAHLKRAFILLSMSRHEEAKTDLLNVLRSVDTTPTDLRSAIEALKSLDSDWVSLIEESPLLKHLAPEDVSIISGALQFDAKAVPLASRLLERAYGEIDNSAGTHGQLRSNLVLSLISSGQFQKAMDIICSNRAQVLSIEDIPDIFNYAMAEWGHTNIPPEDLFEHALELAEVPSDVDANFYQCLALASAVIGDTNRALDFLNTARDKTQQGVIFSCWTYLSRRRTAMLSDLDAMEAAFKSGTIVPPVISRDARAYTSH
ncbi:cellulose biosynthesis protein BcsQ [Aminobacter aminovorans]|uniref:Cell division inhibitor MinD n=1 Tax=Aminobacter aminovorans TaxID=83263 RepID=A0A380WNZ3_AMIAI|nr:ParA family protein [Aminobacter aminovorans]TCS29860.1 cellulose biosynthesis protein BcsQ [Aminobacter aminovorans]SUU90709.1 cell division inhibitor MinD [Aminobacter aminovorans]